MQVKFVVGQVWKCPKSYPNTKFTITKINLSDGQVLAFRTDLGKEAGFAYVDKNGMGSIDPSWSLVHDIDDWRAWRHNRPGDCVCGILRSLCDYHR